METVQPKLALDSDLLSKGRKVFRAINHPLRQQMIQLIHSSGRINVTDIYSKMRLEQSAASQHLAILRKERFVTAIRSAKMIFYSVNYDRINHVQKLSKEIGL